MKNKFVTIIILAFLLQLIFTGIFAPNIQSDSPGLASELLAFQILGTLVTAPLLVVVVSSIAKNTRGTALNVVAVVVSFLLHYLLVAAIYVPLIDAIFPTESTLSFAPLLPGVAALGATLFVAPILGVVTAKVVSVGAKGRRKTKKRS